MECRRRKDADKEKDMAKYRRKGHGKPRARHERLGSRVLPMMRTLRRKKRREKFSVREKGLPKGRIETSPYAARTPFLSRP